jgi:hypothetical protein
VSDLFSALIFAFAGYHAVESLKHIVGLILMIAHKDKAAAWWHREVIENG